MLPSENRAQETKVETRRGLINVTEVQTDIRTTIYRPLIGSDGSQAYAGRATHVRKCSKTYRINKAMLIMVLLLVMAGLYLSKSELIWALDFLPEQLTEKLEYYSVENKNAPFDEDGFIFRNSSREYLGEADLKRLEEISKETDYSYKDLIRFGVNEIYARYGYAFEKGGKYEQHYGSYDWYQTMQKGKAAYEQFNIYEKANIDLLVSLENERKDFF